MAVSTMMPRQVGRPLAVAATGFAFNKFPSNPLSDVVGTSSNRTTISFTTGAAHTWGASYTEIDPSLSADCDGIAINMRSVTGAGATNSSTLLRIGTGAGGAETTWATIAIGYGAYASGAGAEYGGGIYIPGRITSGTRVAVKAQSARASLSCSAIFTFLRSDKTVDFGSPVSMCFDEATSKGVDLTAPGSLNTKSEWTELVASTSQAFTALSIGVQGAASTDIGTGNALIDIGTGAGGVESVLIPDIHTYISGGNEQITPFTPTTYGVDIPSGTRIVGRFARSAATQTLDICLAGA